MNEFWTETVKLAISVAKSSVAERFRLHRQELNELGEGEPEWKVSLSNWMQAGPPKAHPLKGLELARQMAQVHDAAKIPNDDAWLEDFLRCSQSLRVFVFRLMEFLRSRLPGYPFLWMLHRAIPLPGEVRYGMDTCIPYDPKYNPKSLSAFAPIPTDLLNDCPTIPTLVSGMVAALISSEHFPAAKQSDKELSRDPSLEQVHLVLQANLKEEITRLSSLGLSPIDMYSRSRQYRDELYTSHANSRIRRQYLRYREMEDVIQGVYGLMSTVISGGQFWKWPWESNRLDDVTFSMAGSHLQTRIRTLSAPEFCMLLEGGEILGFDFNPVFPEFAGLHKVQRHTMYFANGANDIEAVLLAGSKECLDLAKDFSDKKSSLFEYDSSIVLQEKHTS